MTLRLGREFNAEDASAWGAGVQSDAYEVLGAHHLEGMTTFRVWAPNATRITAIGDFNEWTALPEHSLEPDSNGIWSGVMAAQLGDRYKYRIDSAPGSTVDKADPFGFSTEEPPRTASVIVSLDHEWSDQEWMSTRGERSTFNAAMSIYELHLGSWRYEPGGYVDIARQLSAYAIDLGFTHVELLPLTEHPFYGSWGYLTTGYFAVTARYGQPTEFMEFVDILHQAGIGVILDWAPAHFPDDIHALGEFDGTHLFEHADPRLGRHPDWNSYIFNYDRAEVRSFLISSANFFLDMYHIDCLRVDAVTSMLFRDFSRKEGEWIPNEFGGNENLGAVSFLQQLNQTVRELHPGVRTIAEESAAWPGVTTGVESGGLGFSYKWDLGWTRDMLSFIAHDPIERGRYSQKVTFRPEYATKERFVLPLSHDEVVDGARSLVEKMPGDGPQQLANLRLLLGYQWAIPGKKLLFMGGEFAQSGEWDHESELDWQLLDDPAHGGVQRFVKELNGLYRSEPAMHLGDHEEEGFEWIVGDDTANSVYAFLRKAPGHRPVLVLANFSTAPHQIYRVGVPVGGMWEPLLQSDAVEFGGYGMVGGPVAVDASPSHHYAMSLPIVAAPLAISFFAPAEGDAGR